MTRKEAFDEINRTQDFYIDELIKLMNDSKYDSMKMISFTSPTGTGKTKMMSKLINKYPDYYFIITTLSKGQLHLQVRDSLRKDCKNDNFVVYGSADYKINSKLQAEDIIGAIPENTKCIWLRDEGHIHTNRYDELLIKVCYKVINFSATNVHSDIQCNFIHTMMLRTVNQTVGLPEDAIQKLIEIKHIHKNVSGYNPCAIFRCVGGDDELYNQIIKLCEFYNLKYIDITENTFNMAELCEDDNEYDVIINKFKIVEGIDIRRAHVLYMDNQPKNNATTIQVIGRCRRNALLYRNDIDIMADENKELLDATRECFVYYNVEKMKIDTDTEGELQYAFCNHISCEQLKVGSVINVIDGQLPNGLYVIELKNKTGRFEIKTDENTGFNIVDPITDFYDVKYGQTGNYFYMGYKKISAENVMKFPITNATSYFDYGKGKYITEECESYYLVEYFYLDPIFNEGFDSIYENFMSKPVIRALKRKSDDVIKSRFREWLGCQNGISYIMKDYRRTVNDEEFINIFKQRLTDILYFNDLFEWIYGRTERSMVCSIQKNKSVYRTYDDAYEKGECFGLVVSMRIPVDEVQSKNYRKIINDKESAIIGTDLMHQVSSNGAVKWTELKSVSSKINGYNKLNSFLSKRYLTEIESVKNQLFIGKNNYKLNSKCSSILGYCVEYYSKYLVYGEIYLGNYIQKALDEHGRNAITNSIIVRACMLKYREMMIRTFGSGAAKVVKTISITKLVQAQYREFVRLVVELGTRTAKYVKQALYLDVDEPKCDVDPNLSIDHITGLADYITKDTILDVKVRNTIDEKCIRQVLAYHYLSTKRSDLSIKRVIVYDASSDKAVIVNITDENIKDGDQNG